MFVRVFLFFLLLFDGELHSLDAFNIKKTVFLTKPFPKPFVTFKPRKENVFLCWWLHVDYYVEFIWEWMAKNHMIFSKHNLPCGNHKLDILNSNSSYFCFIFRKFVCLTCQYASQLIAFANANKKEHLHCDLSLV